MSMLFKTVFFLLLICVGSPLSLPALAVETPAETTLATSFPGLDQVVPRSSELSVDASEAIPGLTINDKLEKFQEQLTILETSRAELTGQLESWGEISNWPANRLLDARTSLLDLRERTQELLAHISQPMKNLEAIRNRWVKKQRFWTEWQEELTRQGATIPKETFAQVRDTVQDITLRATLATDQLVELQQRVSKAEESSLDWLNHVESTLSGIRRVKFKRNAYPMFSPNYINQINRNLLLEARRNLSVALAIPITFFQGQGWIIVLQIVGSLLIGLTLFARNRHGKPITEEWRFLFRHPFATGLFITLLTTSELYTSPPAFWQLILLGCGATPAVLLIRSQWEKAKGQYTVLTLAVLFVTSEAFKLIGLPRPLFRLYLVLLCATIVPMLLRAARREAKANKGKMTTAALLLYMGSFLGFLGLLTQATGFSTLSANLIDATLGTAFVLLVAKIALLLGNGGIVELLRLDWIKNRVFVKRLGRKTETRLREPLRLFIAGYTLLYLLYLWNISPSPAEAWETILKYEIELGDFRISVGLIIYALATLYLTLVISWVFQAFLDAQILTPQRRERGVKEAVKKLVHYSFVLTGFFLAVSIAGIGLEKFAIFAGALGVGIGFGLQNIVNNFVSGLILLFERPIKVGDTINIDEQWGKITHIGLRSTVFETLDHAEIIVPNSELVSQKVTNWTFTTNVSRVVLSVGVAYGSPLDKVLAVLHRVADEHPDIIDEPKPSAIFTGFGASSIDFELRVWISDINERLKIKSELGQAIDSYFRAENITIPFPQRDLHLRSIDRGMPNILGKGDD